MKPEMIAKLKAKWADLIRSTTQEMVCNMDTPTQRTINRFFERTGIKRLTKVKGGYIDTWDLLTSDDGEQPQVIPARIAERWMTY